MLRAVASVASGGPGSVEDISNGAASATRQPFEIRRDGSDVLNKNCQRSFLDQIRRHALSYAAFDESLQQAETGAGLEPKEKASVETLGAAFVGFYVIHPNYWLKISWDLLLSILILFSVTIIPFRLGFHIETLSDTEKVIDYSIDILFGLDMLANLNTAFYNESKELITGRFRIALEYLKLWFFIDFFSTVPIDHIASAAISSGSDEDGAAGLRSLKIIRVIRLVRLLKLARVLKLKKLSEHVENLDVNPGIIILISLILKILFVAHLLCCVWAYIGIEGTHPTWITAFGVQTEDIEGLYVSSLYWTIATMMSVGYGDVSAQNVDERMFSILSQIVGAATFGVILVTVNSLAAGNPLEFAKTNKLFELKSLLRYHNAPKTLRRKIIAYFTMMWAIKSPVDEDEMFHDLSEPLRLKLALHAYQDVIDNSPVLKQFYKYNPNFVAEMVQYIMPRTFDVGDELFRKLWQSEGLYIVSKGVLEIVGILNGSPPGQQLADSERDSEVVAGICISGGHFGQEVLLREQIPEYSSLVQQFVFRAAAPCDMFVLNQKALERAMYMYPTVKKLMRRGVVQRYNGYLAACSHVCSAGVLDRARTEDADRPIVRNEILMTVAEVEEWPTQIKVEIVNTADRLYKCYNTRSSSGYGNLTATDEAAATSRSSTSSYVYTHESSRTLLRRGLIHPEEKVKVKWDLMIASFILYSVVSIPFRLSFGPDEVDGLAFYFETLVDLSFGVDMLLSCRTVFFYKEQRVYVCIPRRIYSRYLTGWFLIDFFSTVPMDKIISMLPGTNAKASNLRTLKLIRTVRLIRLVKLVRLLKLGKLINSIEEFFRSPAVLQLFMLLFQVVFVAHLLACFWFFVGTGASTRTETDNGQAWYKHAGLQDASPAECYLASLYWAFTTMTTVGYGDILAQRTTEKLYACYAMILGATVFGYVVGSIASLSRNFNVGSTRSKARLEEVRSYLREKKLPKKMRADVERYYVTLLDYTSAFDVENILKGLPRALHVELFMHVHGTTTKCIKFFQGKPPYVAVLLCNKMRPQFHSPLDLIFVEADIGLEMFFIVFGKVNLWQLAGGPFARTAGSSGPQSTVKLTTGDHFGQECLLEGGSRSRSAAAVTFLWLLVLTKNDLGSILADRMDVAEEIKGLLVKPGSECSLKNLKHLVIQMSARHRRILVREELRRRALVLSAVTEFSNMRSHETE